MTALFSGHHGKGPRYCPSIEDKIHGLQTRTDTKSSSNPKAEILLRPTSTAFRHPPKEAQLAAMRLILASKRTHVPRGYAVEYDYPPTQLRHTLETKALPTSISRDKSMAPQDTRKPHAKDDGRYQRVPLSSRTTPTFWAEKKRTSASSLTTSSPRHRRTLPHVHQPRRIPHPAAPGQRGPTTDTKRQRTGTDWGPDWVHLHKQFRPGYSKPLSKPQRSPTASTQPVRGTAPHQTEDPLGTTHHAPRSPRDSWGRPHTAPNHREVPTSWLNSPRPKSSTRATSKRSKPKQIACAPWNPCLCHGFGI